MMTRRALTSLPISEDLQSADLQEACKDMLGSRACRESNCSASEAHLIWIYRLFSSLYIKLRCDSSLCFQP